MYSVWVIAVTCWFLISLCRGFERRSFSQSLQYGLDFNAYTSQICGYVTADINNPLACNDGQYCTTISGFFGCCNTVALTFTSATLTQKWTITLSQTAEGTVTSGSTWSGSLVSYSYQSCSVYTTCYNSWAAKTSCTGDCISNNQNMLCTGSEFPYCRTLTMPHYEPNATYTAFWCAKSSGFLPLYNAYFLTPVRTDETTTTTSGSYSPTAFTPTSVTQSSKSAAAANTITVAPTSTNNAISRSALRTTWLLLTLLLSI